jgi:geranylgeranyl diphosphate synthase, type II
MPLKPLTYYSTLFESFLSQHPMARQPFNLYEPADYILSLGGKRLRPLFVLMGCDSFDGNLEEAMNAAMAVEIFHNFTLLHDDIMDNADVRRGKATVHIKYNTNTAILSGDVMLIKAYEYLMNIPDAHVNRALLQTFNKMAIEVCEGQQMDVDFETRDDVTISEYIEMITNKTSVLIGAAIQMGAIVASASKSDQEHMYQFAKNFGIAFQLQDDVLDTFGEAASVGKRIGGDILQNKKTYLYLKSLELASSSQKETLLHLYAPNHGMDEETKIAEVKSIFNSVLVTEYARQVIEAYRDLAISHLVACNVSDETKNSLTNFVNQWIHRSS